MTHGWRGQILLGTRVLGLFDVERVERIGEFWSYPRRRA